MPTINKTRNRKKSTRWRAMISKKPHSTRETQALKQIRWGDIYLWELKEDTLLYLVWLRQILRICYEVSIKIGGNERTVSVIPW